MLACLLKYVVTDFHIIENVSLLSALQIINKE